MLNVPSKNFPYLYLDGTLKIDIIFEFMSLRLYII